MEKWTERNGGGGWSACLWVGCIVATLVGASSGCSATGEAPWLVEPDTGAVDGRGTDVAGSGRPLREARPGETVCGEPDQIVETLAALRKLKGCDVFRGSIDFADDGGKDIWKNLEHFPDFRVVRGDFELYALSPMESLSGLEHLEFIGGKFALTRLWNLRNTQGLRRLRRVGGELEIAWTGDESLTTLDGFRQLRSTASLVISRTSIEELDGLSGLRRVRGDLTIPVSLNKGLSEKEVRSFVSDIDVEGEVRICDAGPACENN